MSYLQVKLVSDSALLMNNPESMFIIGEKPSATKSYIPEVEAEKKAYWNKDKTSLVVPARCIHAMLVAGCDRRYKIGKLSAKSYVAGCINIQPENIELETSEYEIDARSVVIQKARVMSWRPKLENWELTFDIIYDNDIFSGSEQILIDLFNDCGKRIGLLDYRPAKKGPFGRFHIDEWKIV